MTHTTNIRRFACWRWLAAATIVLALTRVGSAEFTYTQQRDVNYAQLAAVAVDTAQPIESAHHCDLLIPDGEGPFPGVLVVHGGAWLTGDKSHMSRVSKALAEHGYTVCSINYRLAPKHPFPAQIDDCKLAMRWLLAHSGEFKLDPLRLGAFGYSAGGQLVALLGVTDAAEGSTEAKAADRQAARLQCLVAGGAPCDFRSIKAESLGLSYWLGGSRADKPAVYEQASPISFVTADDPPSFFFHGEADKLVPPQSAQAMVERLTAAGVSATFYPIPAAGHIEAFKDADALSAAIEFLDKHLHPAPQEP